MATILNSRYNTPLLMKYGSKVVYYRLKRHCKAFSKWLDETYPITYKDIKEGDCFILWNGNNCPVAFIQMKDEGSRADKWNRPTRLNDGSYYGLKSDDRVRLSDPIEARELIKECREIDK